MTETQVEGTMIPEAVPVKGTAPRVAMLEGATTEPGVPVAPEPTEEVHDDTLPEASMDVVVRSPEIQDAEPIRSAPMSEAAPTSRGRLENLSDDLIDLATVAQN
jgi:aspartate-semialdehyde dehydrogenase